MLQLFVSYFCHFIAYYLYTHVVLSNSRGFKVFILFRFYQNNLVDCPLPKKKNGIGTYELLCAHINAYLFIFNITDYSI